MTNVTRPAAALLLALLLYTGTPAMAHAAPSSPTYFNLCQNTLTKWLCPR